MSTIEPIGATRESFYEAKLLLALPWFCSDCPEIDENEKGRRRGVWTFQCKPPISSLEGTYAFKVGADNTPSFEVLCQQFESTFCSIEADLVCKCCAGELDGAPCRSCKHATGFHLCRNPNAGDNLRHRWRKGTLFAGPLDIQRVLFNLHRKMLPDHVLEAKAMQYEEAKLIDKDTIERTLKCIRLERGTTTYLNDGVDDEAEERTEAARTADEHTKLRPDALKKLLDERVEMMKAGKGGDGITDQYRVYRNIIDSIEGGSYLRMMVQASAGTGKVPISSALSSRLKSMTTPCS